MVRIGRTWSEYGLCWEKKSENGLNCSKAKAAYLSTSSEYEYGTFILGMNAGQAQGIKVVSQVQCWLRRNASIFKSFLTC